MSVPSPNAIKAGDTTPLVATLSDERGPVNLAGTSVEFRMQSKVTGSGIAPIAAAAEVLQGVDDNGAITNRGQVEYAWGPGETDVPGLYGFEFAVTFTDGSVRTFPNDRTVLLEIVAAA